MKHRPANPASVYRVHSPREAEEDYKRHIPGIARAFIADMIGGPPLWIRALTSSDRLPRNYFTTARTLTRDEVVARMRARASDDLERRRLDHIRAEMRYGS